MNSTKYFASAVLLSTVISAPIAAHAAQPGFYAGLGLGQGDDLVLDQTQTAFKMFGGYNFNRFIGMELSYVDLGNNYTDYYGTSFTQDGLSYEIVLNLPVSPTIDLFAKYGLYSWTVSSNYYYYNGYNYYYSSTSGTNDDYGFGISAQIAPRLWVRGEYQKYMDVAGGDVSMVSASIAYHF
jgi:OOP family OmpA-OmpF porin